MKAITHINFVISKKKFPDEIQSEEKADRKKTYAERTDYVSHIFINFVYFLIFADKS